MMFEVESLLAAARDSTGLHDFGDPTFRDGLDVLIDALSAEARLNAVGQMAFHGQISGYLCERLRIEDWYRRHPEIAAVAIESPILVTGLPRTGTTALSNLLAADPVARSLRYWESQRPTPPPQPGDEVADTRVTEADAGLAALKHAAPELAAMHDDTALSPTEHQDLLGQHFRTQHFEGLADVPRYIRWWIGCDMARAYRHHRRVLKLLQWRCPPTRWNLKKPPEVSFLDAFSREYPDARIVWTHRDPAKVLPSVCKLIAILRAMFCESVDLHALGHGQLALWSEGIRRALAFRRSAGESRFADVYMHDLVSRPLETVAAVYERFDLAFTAAAERGMRAWVTANPQHKHGAPRYTLEEFGLTLPAVREAFADYVRHFDVPLEA